MPNAEMHELWNGPASAGWAAHADRYDRMLAGLGLEVLDAADLRPGERVLDVGCGSGQLSRQAAARVGPSGSVVGLDLSHRLVALATERSAATGGQGSGAAQVRHAVADVQVDDLPGAPYDVVLSRFGVMFFDDPVTAFARLRAAAPGGRLAFVCWQGAEHNAWVYVALAALLPHVGVPTPPAPGVPGPFAFGDEDTVRAVLGGAGWSAVRVRSVEASLLVGGGGSVDDVVAWYTEDAFGRALLAPVGPAARAAAVAALREVVAARAGADGLRLGAAVHVVTASA